MIRTYTDLIKLPTFKERFEYLKLNGNVSEETFGFDRYLNQVFYRSPQWKKLRNQIIIRDNGCDLAIEGRDILDRIYIHHMNPLRKGDITTQSEYLINPEYLICTSFDTHQAIHYGNIDMLPRDPVIRTAGDTTLW